MSHSWLTAACGLLAASISAVAAFAHEPPTVRRTTTVSLEGLDLTSPVGARAAAMRVRAAAEKACRQPNTPLLPRAAAAERTCFDAAVSAALRELAAPATAAGSSGR